ncbi:hypothetical protein CJ263_03095 [Maribacter cobaltidurans]|uniref:ABC transmembrane type-1 domain-containing protein n=1 Tax=Maribacter cobaltidurans TaxID=1178778 RepID=A0A223V226_9FLAO|nr:hypothetical protein CJ263_03095 [Maribacter cobaltidurans]
MLLCLIKDNNVFQIVFLAVVILYFPITLGIFFFLFLNTLTNIRDIQEHFMTLLLVLLNFPFGVLYVTFLPF